MRSINLWATPRSRSSALMRSWGSRCDTVVTDEPLYGYYLKNTGVPDPGREDVLDERSSDFRMALEGPEGMNDDTDVAVWFKKHLANHLVYSKDVLRINPSGNCYLIRHPILILRSMQKVSPPVDVAELGTIRQYEIWQKYGGPVIDSNTLVTNTEPTLRRLCSEFGVAFDPAMLKWVSGPREYDGSWGKYWYKSLWNSTGFGGSPDPSGLAVRALEKMPGLLDAIECYEELLRHSLDEGD
jgi:hypothetical protein